MNHEDYKRPPGGGGGEIIVSVTFNIMWDEWCPPSDASRLPGRPAVSQFEQMSMSIVKQSTQRKRAPTMSCWQLHPHQRKDTEVYGENHPLETLDARVLDYPKGEGISVNGHGMYCCNLRDSSALSNVSTPSELSKEQFDREGGFTRNGWMGWMLCTSLSNVVI